MNFCPVCRAELSIKKLESEDRERLICISQTCTFIHYDNPMPVVAAVIEYQGKILLAHNVQWPAKWFGLITGFLEKAETPEQGIVREVKEETNLDAKVESLIGLYTFERMNQLIIAYHVTATGDIHLNEELDEFRLYEIDKAKYWPAGTGYALRDFIKKRLPDHEPQMLSFE